MTDNDKVSTNGSAIAVRGTVELDRPQRERQLDRLSFEPNDLASAQAMSIAIVKSGMYPQFKVPEQALMALMQGRELGLPTLASLNGIDVINGRPSLRTITLIALVQTSGKARYFRLKESTEERATWVTARADDPQGTEIAGTYTLQDADRMGMLGKDQWKKQPGNMLVQRAASKLVRLVYQDVVVGLATTEELIDEVPTISKSHASSLVTGHAETSRVEASTPVGVVDQVRAKLAAKAPKTRERKATDTPAELVDAPAASVVASNARARLLQVQGQLVEAYGAERVKEAWLKVVGPTKGVSDESAFGALGRAEDLARRFELAELINAEREQIRLYGGQASDVKRPEDHEIPELEEWLRLARDEAQARLTGTAREPGSEG